jgi:ribosome modulation factor
MVCLTVAPHLLLLMLFFSEMFGQFIKRLSIQSKESQHVELQRMHVSGYDEGVQGCSKVFCDCIRRQTLQGVRDNLLVVPPYPSQANANCFFTKCQGVTSRSFVCWSG